ncbi:Rid family hydrolase [Microbacterium sp. LMI1-1-1.1]|uniref:Rid family hydrolase n=1 Tax=Microbacterium sp. LMI1-1-1.1 TaxID=3135223 RepID=UPI003465AD3F
MSVDRLTPPGMFQPVPYHHVAVGTGTRHIHVAGQISRNEEADRLFPDDLVGQVGQAFRNAAKGLAAAGASFDDVVRMRFFLTRSRPEMFEDFMAGIEAVRVELQLPSPLPPLSAIGVDFLFEPDVLVELEVYAVLP